MPTNVNGMTTIADDLSQDDWKLLRQRLGNRIQLVGEESYGHQ